MIQDTPDYSAYRFLIVDDKPFLRSLINGMLVRCHANSIEHAANGKVAIERLTAANGNFDCVLCDWNMEPGDGLEVLRAIRSGSVPHTARDVHFVMLTGHADEHIVRAAIQLDTNGFVVKPVSLKKLIRAIDTAFANPVALKSKEAYLSNATVMLPGGMPNPEKRTPPWVLLSKMRRNDKDAVASRLDQIQSESNEPGGLQTQFKRLLINKRRVDLAGIASGKVLAEDIYTEENTLLLSAGMVLSDLLLGRLRELETASSEPIQLLVGDYGD